MSRSLVLVHFLDGASKTFFAEPEMTAAELRSEVVDAIELGQAANDFGFLLVKDGTELYIKDEDIILDVVDAHDPSHVALSADSKLIFQRVFFSEPEEIIEDTLLTRLMFAQSLRCVLAGRWPVTVDQAVELAGVLVAEKYGAAPEPRAPGFLLPHLDDFVPKLIRDRLKPKAWEARILAEAAGGADLSQAEAQARYLAYVRANVGMYGLCSYDALHVEKHKYEVKWQVFVAPSMRGVVVMRWDGVTEEACYPYERVSGWESVGSRFALHVRAEDGPDEAAVTFVTPHAEQLARLTAVHARRALAEQEEH